MNVAFDISPLESGHKTRGIGVYTELLLDALKRYFPYHAYQLIRRGQKIPRNADIVHYPYFDPFFLTFPFRFVKPTIVTVHDLIPIAYPDHFPRGIRGELKWQLQKRIAGGARAIIANSKSTKNDVVRLLGYPEDRVYVTYLAPREIFSSVRKEEMLIKTKKKYNLNNKFILYVGDVNWNKNILNLLLSIDKIDKKYSNFQIVLVGGAFVRTTLPETRAIDTTIQELNLKNRVKKLGFISDDELACLYSLADVFVYPSIVEGFGLPVLEAMASGCPVVTSDAASLKEIAGPAIVVNPRFTDSIAHGIQDALTLTPAKKARMKKEEESWSSGFTWKRVARETIRVYEKVLGDI